MIHNLNLSQKMVRFGSMKMPKDGITNKGTGINKNIKAGIYKE